MSMFTREPNFEEEFKVGDRFVLMGLQYTGTIRTRNGEAHRSLVTAVTRDSYPNQRTFSVIGVGFKTMAERAERSDFPTVVEYIRVPLSGGRDVKRLAPVTRGGEPLDPGAFVRGEDGDPVDVDAFATPDTAPSGDDGPGF